MLKSGSVCFFYRSKIEKQDEAQRFFCFEFSFLLNFAIC
ncbi:MAG: hypothetical protein MRERC_3c001 [Mycoplasmataceae bacterium RC_NB112A]|nr:MAG: hypothetical protein MRERC_3c001 [Mycoplasmataceae bacterium RC_NB112A]